MPKIPVYLISQLHTGFLLARILLTVLLKIF